MHRLATPMSYFAVVREAGPGWQPGKSMRDQPGWAEHAAFMDRLTDDGFVLFGGPLAGSEHARVRALLIMHAASEKEIRRRLDDDPWTPSQLLSIASVEPWQLVMGEERIAALTAARKR